MAITDKFSKVGEPGSATYLANPGYSMGGSSINIQTYVGWPTGKVIFDMYTTRLVGNEEKAADNTRTSWQGIHNGSGTITSLQKLSGNDQNYTAGTTTRVIITHSAHWANQLIDGITAHANQDGTLKTTAVQNALNLGTQDLNGWNPIGYTATFLQNNGNKETVVNYAGDLTTILSPGMKVAYTRSVAPPTQCMAFQASSSQYATKASPTGMTFTSAFTLEAWVYLNSYGISGQSQHIISRRNGTDGFNLEIQTSGQVAVYYGGSGATRAITTNESLPLRRWVHLSVVVTNVSTGAATIYINGRSVSTFSAGAATVLTQGGNITLGQYNGGGFFADCYLGEARAWSTARTQAEILANMNNNLTGSESGLVGLWRGDNNFNDLTANANHLTATNGATATQNANPFNLIEYGKVTKVGAFSGGVTPVTVFTGTDCNIPNMALTSPLYSTVAAPYGFPASKDKWTVTVLNGTQTGQSSPAANTWYNLPAFTIQAPTGQWIPSVSSNLYADKASAGPLSARATLSTTSTGESDPALTGGFSINPANSAANQITRSGSTISVQAAQSLYLNVKTLDTSINQILIIGSGSAVMTQISLELAY